MRRQYLPDPSRCITESLQKFCREAQLRGVMDILRAADECRFYSMIEPQRGSVLLQKADDQVRFLTLLPVVEHVHDLLVYSSSPLPVQFSCWDYEKIVGRFIVHVSEFLGIFSRLNSTVDDELVRPNQFPAIFDSIIPRVRAKSYDMRKRNRKQSPILGGFMQQALTRLIWVSMFDFI